MKILILENNLLEGKNLEKTLDIYAPKFSKFLSIDDEHSRYTIKSILSLDPTYVENSSTTGDYGDWLLRQMLKNNFRGWSNDSITELLSDFIDKKANLDNKDINYYKTPEDLSDILSKIELTDRQKHRRNRHSKDYQFITENDDWELYVPTTQQGACTLGSGTEWCTAYSGGSNYYTIYTKDNNKLFIFINKNNPSKKYQLSFYQAQFLEEDDDTVVDILDFFSANLDLYDAVLKIEPNAKNLVKNWFMNSQMSDTTEIVYDGNLYKRDVYYVLDEEYASYTYSIDSKTFVKESNIAVNDSMFTFIGLNYPKDAYDAVSDYQIEDYPSIYSIKSKKDAYLCSFVEGISISKDYIFNDEDYFVFIDNRAIVINFTSVTCKNTDGINSSWITVFRKRFPEEYRKFLRNTKGKSIVKNACNPQEVTNSELKHKLNAKLENYFNLINSNDTDNVLTTNDNNYYYYDEIKNIWYQIYIGHSYNATLVKDAFDAIVI